MAPTWLIDYWKQEPNWVRRYVRGSFELNMIMCGLKVDKGHIWTKKAISEFQKHMAKVKQVLAKDTILYRGTSEISPTMEKACVEMSNCHFMSTSKSQAIAKEFARKGGYVHKFICRKGLAIYDLEDLYEGNVAKREKEVLIYPGCTMKLISMKGHILEWELTQ